MFATLLTITRPRFWLYTLGTYAVGLAAGAPTWKALAAPSVFLHLVYFCLFANLLIYGVNDLYDAETDAHNPKKGGREHLLAESEYKWLKVALAISVLVSFGFAAFSANRIVLGLWVVFLFLSWFYSATPFRFKGRPFWDFVVNGLYAVPGFIGYAQFTGRMPPVWAIAAAWSWTGAMHLFSAVPDIEADIAGRVKTTAVALRRQHSLLLCAALWFVTVAALWYGGFYRPWCLLALPYALVPLILMRSNSETVAKAYWYFPLVNGIYGFVLFWLLAFGKPYG